MPLTKIKFRISLLLLLFFFFMTVPAQAQRKSLAVLEFARVETPKNVATAVSDGFRTQFVNMGKYKVIDRTQMEQILKEQRFQATGFTNKKKAAEIGKVLNVQFIVTGRINRVSGVYQVNASIIDVESAEVLTADSKVHDLNDFIGLLENKIPAMAFKLARQANENETKKPGRKERREPAARYTPPKKLPRTYPLNQKSGKPKFTISGSLVGLEGNISSSTDSVQYLGSGVGVGVSLEKPLSSKISVYLQGHISGGTLDEGFIGTWGRTSLSGGGKSYINKLFFGAYGGLTSYTISDSSATIEEAGINVGGFVGVQVTPSMFLQGEVSIDILNDSTGLISDDVVFTFLNAGLNF